jgi:hypothetical protein
MLKDRVNPVEVPRILHRLKSRVLLGFKDNQTQDAVGQRDDFFLSSHFAIGNLVVWKSLLRKGCGPM